MCVCECLFFLIIFINVEFVVFIRKKNRNTKFWFLEDAVHKSYDYLHMNMIDL